MRRIVLPSLACPALQYFSVSHMYCCILRCLVCIVFICVYCCGCLVCIVVILCVFVVLCVYCCSCLVCIVVVLCVLLLVVLCVLLSSYVYLLYYVCIAVFTLDAGLLARSQYSEGPATGHLNSGFSWFPCA